MSWMGKKSTSTLTVEANVAFIMILSVPPAHSHDALLQSCTMSSAFDLNWEPFREGFYDLQSFWWWNISRSFKLISSGFQFCQLWLAYEQNVST